jgi:hypothetical protein
MKVPGLMSRQRVILNPQSSIMIATTAGRNPEKLTVQHNGFLKFSSFRFHFLIGILVDEPDRIGKACIPALKKVSN